MYRIRPEHPTVNQNIAYKILSGFVQLRRALERFTETGVVFVGDEDETPLDAVILVTGYEIKFPFISDKILRTKNNVVDMFKNMFLPYIEEAHTLAFVGLFQPFGPGAPIFELQARLFVQFLKT